MLNTIHTIAFLLMGISFCFNILNWIERDSYINWIMHAFWGTSAFIFSGIGLIVHSSYIRTGLDIAITIYCALYCWKNKNDRNRKKNANKIVGEKTLRLIKKMARKLNPSPIPVPENR